jgi:hypothetical protein
MMAEEEKVLGEMYAMRATYAAWRIEMEAKVEKQNQLARSLKGFKQNQPLPTTQDAPALTAKNDPFASVYRNPNP